MYSTALHGNGLRVLFKGDKGNISDYMGMSRFRDWGSGDKASGQD